MYLYYMYESLEQNIWTFLDSFFPLFIRLEFQTLHFYGLWYRLLSGTMRTLLYLSAFSSILVRLAAETNDNLVNSSLMQGKLKKSVTIKTYNRTRMFIHSFVYFL